MDETDRRIADLLGEDGRASHRAIADALGLSPRLVASRIDSMLEKRILKIAAVADVFAAGNDLVLAVGVAVRGRATLDVAEELAALEEVCAVNVVSGEFDLEVLILSADHETLREFVANRVSSIRGIESLSPALSLELFKFESTWARF
jgi:Lrp/AsnC family transcriptional regulator for asnA, asnC and gidA